MKKTDDIKDVHTQTPVPPNEIKNLDHGQRHVKDTSTSTSDSVGTSTSPVTETKDEENYKKTKKYCDEVIKTYLQGHFDECDTLERDQLLKNANKNKFTEEPEFEIIDGIDVDIETPPGTSRANNCHLPDKDTEIKENDPCFTFISNKKLEKKSTKMDHLQWVNKNISIREPISDVPYLKFQNKQQQTNDINIDNSEESRLSLKEEGNSKKIIKENKSVATEPDKLRRYFSIIGLKKTIDTKQNTDDSPETSTMNSANSKKTKKTNKKKGK